METSQRDPQVWRIAKARAKFKSHLFTYLAVNALLWTIWFVTDGHSTPLPWPVWSTVFWGIGLVIQGSATYGFISKESLSEREYARLMRQRTDQA